MQIRFRISVFALVFARMRSDNDIKSHALCKKPTQYPQARDAPERVLPNRRHIRVGDAQHAQPFQRTEYRTDNDVVAWPVDDELRHVGVQLVDGHRAQVT